MRLFFGLGGVGNQSGCGQIEDTWVERIRKAEYNACSCFLAIRWPWQLAKIKGVKDPIL